MTVVLLSDDLLFGSRILGAAEQSGVPATRITSPAELPPASDVDLLLVDWAARSADWGDLLHAWCADAPESDRPRVILYGPHTDLEAHAAARSADLGPMWARSKLLSNLGQLIGDYMP